MFEGSELFLIVQMFCNFLLYLGKYLSVSATNSPAGFVTTIGDLWDFCGLSVAFVMCLYNNAAKIVCMEGFLRIHFVNLL